jgi:predicted XRE-type DNA-binding protein
MTILDAKAVATRQTESRIGVSHSALCRIRQAEFNQFTTDRLGGILARLAQEAEMSVVVHPHPAPRNTRGSTVSEG